MPIIVKDYQWRETEKTLIIQVPLHGINKSKVDTLTTQNYIKASFAPFFFEIFLHDKIIDDLSVCTFHEKEIVYELVKENIKLWGTIEKLMNKDEKNDLRRLAIDEAQNKLNEKLKAEADKKMILKRCAVSESIGLDSEQRKRIEEIKEKEKTSALGDVNCWRKKAIAAPTSNKSIPQKPKTRSKYYNLDKEYETKTAIPLPRSNRTLEVSFTERTLPTPLRESKQEEENEWLRKQAEARRSAGFVSEDLRPEEKNPQYLKAKGDEFMKNKNYLGAISAYSFGINISPNYADLYISRSEAHMEIENYNKAITDCSTALDLMKPEVWSNLNERALCIGRRGILLHKLGMKQQAIDELKASIKLKPENVYFTKYLYHILDELKNQNVSDDEQEI